MKTPSAGGGGFTTFFRRYTKTWLHGVSTAALTAFGALSVLHRGFVAVAIAAYVLPPVVLYATGRSPADGGNGIRSDGTAAAPGGEDGGIETATDGRTPGGTGRPERHSVGGTNEGSGARSAARTDEGPTDRTTAVASDDGTVERPAETDSDLGAEGSWRRVDSPTGTELHDVAVADGDGYAVGADGVVLADGEDGWRTVLSEGPGAAAETLRGVDATDDGGAVWVAGDGGTVARVDTGTDRHVDFTPPAGRTDNVTDVAAAGPTGDETVLLANGSGEVLRGRYGEGDLSWDEPVKPGSGSSVAGVALVDAATGYCCDTNDGVFETTDGGEGFRRVGVGSAEGTLTDVATVGRGDCTVSADDGVLHRHDGGTWTPVRLGDEALAAIALDDGRGVACGDGVVYDRASVADDWERATTAAPGALAGVAIDGGRAIAVGSHGAILERPSAGSD